MADATDELHPYYGPCDAFGPNMTCSECTGLLERQDGSVIEGRSGTLVKHAPISTRIRAAWHAFSRS